MVAVAAMPLLLTFLFAAIDLGRVAFLGAEASTAAHAVCRFVETTPSETAFPDRLRVAALEAAPWSGRSPTGCTTTRTARSPSAAFVRVRARWRSSSRCEHAT